MKWLRMNRTGGRTNIFNLDQITDVYIDDTEVTISLTGGVAEVGNIYMFQKAKEPQEYEVLAGYFLDKVNAYTINL